MLGNPQPPAIHIGSQQADNFSLNDLRFYVWAFDQFIGDVRDLLPEGQGRDLPQQMSLDNLDDFFATELEKDMRHQQYWWMYYDRAAEALPLLESDGPEDYERPLDGKLTREGYDNIRDHTEQEAYINLVSSNVDRKMGTISEVKPTFYAEATNPDDFQAIRSLNYWVEEIKDNTNMAMDYNQYKYDMIALGRGVMRFGHGVDMSNPDFAIFRNMIENRDFITPEELDKYERVFNYHQVEYIPTFNVINYRGAAGPQARSYTHRSHRQVHWLENISVAEARMRYPERANEIHAGISEVAQEMSPYLMLLEDDLEDTVTVSHHRVKFPVIENMDIQVGYPGQQRRETITKDKPRYAIGYVTRVHGTGIVDMDLDAYNHNQFDLVQCVHYPSSKHSCGIGMVKFGRDPAIVHNQLHNGMLRYFGRQIKGGGFILDGVISDGDVKDLSKGNRWVKIDPSKLGFKGRNMGLNDVIMDNRPPAFPSSYAALMQLEEEATDRSMKATDSWKGERAGYSGVQQQLASQDSSMMHTNTTDILYFNAKEMGNILYNNVVQFDGDRQIEFTRKNEEGDKEQHVLNMPDFHYQQWDPVTGYRIVANNIINKIGGLMFNIKVRARSIVPDKPVEKTNFYMRILQFMEPYLQSQSGRILLRNFHNEGMRIPGLAKSMDQIDELSKEQRQLQAQLEQQAQQYEQLRDRREWAKDKAEIDQNLLRLMQKFVADLSKANPETLQMIFSGNYPGLKRDLSGAIDQLTGGTQGASTQNPINTPALNQANQNVTQQ